MTIHLTNEEVPGWEYSVAIFHGLNFSIFICIFISYSYMYYFIKDSGSATAQIQKKRELAAAKKMTLIVITDFCCWIPINIMGNTLMT